MTDIEAMNVALDRIYAETDKDVRELNVTPEDWAWLKVKYKAFVDRIDEIEDTLSYAVGREEFVAVLTKWQRNIRHLLKMLRKKRTDPFFQP